MTLRTTTLKSGNSKYYIGILESIELVIRDNTYVYFNVSILSRLIYICVSVFLKLISNNVVVTPRSVKSSSFGQ